MSHSLQPLAMNPFFVNQLLIELIDYFTDNTRRYHKNIQGTCSYVKHYHIKIQRTLAQSGSTLCQAASVIYSPAHHPSAVTWHVLGSLEKLCLGFAVVRPSILNDSL